MVYPFLVWCILFVVCLTFIVCLQILLCRTAFEEIPRKLHLVVLLDFVRHLLPSLLLFRQTLKVARVNQMR